MGFIFAALFAGYSPKDHADGKAEDRRERNNAAAQRNCIPASAAMVEAAAGCTTKEKFR